MDMVHDDLDVASENPIDVVLRPSNKSSFGSFLELESGFLSIEKNGVVELPQYWYYVHDLLKQRVVWEPPIPK